MLTTFCFFMTIENVIGSIHLNFVRAFSFLVIAKGVGKGCSMFVRCLFGLSIERKRSNQTSRSHRPRRTEPLPIPNITWPNEHGSVRARLCSSSSSQSTENCSTDHSSVHANYCLGSGFATADGQPHELERPHQLANKANWKRSWKFSIK